MPFPPTVRRLILTSPNGASIVLDADEAIIRMFGLNGQLLAELDAAQEFAGDSIFVQRIYDFLGIVRTQISGLQIFIAGNDGKVEIKAGSSGDDNSQPQLTVLPAGAAANGRLKGQAEADNGASTTLESPSYGVHTQSSIVLYAETDVDPSRIAIVTDLAEITNALDVSGNMTAGSISSDTTVGVGTDLIVGDDISATGDLTVGGFANITGALSAASATISGGLNASGLDVLVPWDAWGTYTPAWTASAGAPAIGNGSITGRYKETGRTFHITITLTGGGTTTYGTLGAFWRFGLPASFGVATTNFVGAWRSTDAGVQEYTGIACLDAGTDTIELFKEVGRHGNNTPFTFGSGDTLKISMTAESDT